MNQHPDKLFREKLELHQRPAPASAWYRIEAGLHQKNKKIAWPLLRVAATLLLVALGTWIFWPSPAPSKIEEHTAETKNVKPKTQATSPLGKIPTENQTAKVEPVEKATTETSDRKNVAVTTTPKKHTEEKSIKAVATKDVESIQTTKNESNTTFNVLPTIEKEETSIQPLATASVKGEKNIKLVYTASASEKYLKKTVSDEATTDDKKSSRLQRLLDKAEDLTTNQDPIGDLRQAKNEILALNFRSEKDRGQNK